MELPRVPTATGTAPVIRNHPAREVRAQCAALGKSLTFLRAGPEHWELSMLSVLLVCWRILENIAKDRALDLRPEDWNELECNISLNKCPFGALYSYCRSHIIADPRHLPVHINKRPSSGKT
jgi:hypothetical protein